MAARVAGWGCRFAPRSMAGSSRSLLSLASGRSTQRPVLRSPRILRASYSSAPGGSGDGPVELVYDLHAPAKPVGDNKTQPILFLHGLFGSKKNNRSISRQVHCSFTCAMIVQRTVPMLTAARMLARDLGRSVYALVRWRRGLSFFPFFFPFCSFFSSLFVFPFL